MGTKPAEIAPDEVLPQARAAAIDDQFAGDTTGPAPEAEEIPRPVGDRDLDELAAAADSGDEVAGAYFEGIYQGVLSVADQSAAVFPLGPDAVLVVLEQSLLKAELAHLAVQEGGLVSLLEEARREAAAANARMQQISDLIDEFFGPDDEDHDEQVGGTD